MDEGPVWARISEHFVDEGRGSEREQTSFKLQYDCQRIDVEMGGQISDDVCIRERERKINVVMSILYIRQR